MSSSDPMGRDPGLLLVNDVFDKMMIDAEWSVREARGFTWWPHEYAQHVFAGEPFEEDGVLGCRVHAETDVLVSEEEAPEQMRRLSSLMRFPPMAALYRDAESRRIRLWSSVFVHERLVPYLGPRFAVAAALQATYAQLGSVSLAEIIGLPDTKSAHPSSGPRTHPDDMLNLAAARVLPAGEGGSRWNDPSERLAIAEELADAGAKAQETPRGLNARFPFRRDGQDDPLSPRRSCLLQVRSDEPHAELGRGVFLRLFLPLPPQALTEPPATAAMRLNELERKDPRFSRFCLGSWCLEQSEPEIAATFDVAPAPPRLTYVLFVPNYLHAENVLRTLTLDMAARALWAAHLFTHGREEVS